MCYAPVTSIIFWTVLSECNQVLMEERKTVRSSSYIFTSRVHLMTLRCLLEPDAEELSVVRECHQLAVVSADVDLLPCQDRRVQEYILLTLRAYTLHPMLYFL